MNNSPFSHKLVAIAIILSPLGLIGAFLAPSLIESFNNPTSRSYSSFLGYPVRQRIAGEPIKVQTVTMTSKFVREEIAAPGESAALKATDIRPQVSGTVRELYIAEGDRVRQGQVLIRLEASSFQGRVEKAQNNLAVAESNLRALQASINSKLNELENQVQNYQLRLQNTSNQLQKTDALADAQIKTKVQSALARLKTSRQRLKQIEALVAEGAFSKFQLYDAQDAYATNKREYELAQQGIFDNQNSRFNNRDIFLDHQKELAQAIEALNLAKKKSSQELSSAQLLLDTHRLELQQAIRDLRKTEIIAPSDGLVRMVNIQKGEYADADARTRPPLMTLTRNVVFRAYIDQAQVGTVRVDDKANVRLVAYPGQVFSGKVIRVNPTVETTNPETPMVGTNRQFTYTAWVSIDGLEIPEGLQGFVQFSKERSQPALLLPEESVTHLSGGEGMVMIIESGLSKVKRVKLGRKFGNQREILHGLKENTEVVLYPKGLNPGDRLVGILQQPNSASRQMLVQKNREKQ